MKISYETKVVEFNSRQRRGKTVRRKGEQKQALVCKIY